jgi:hypothetical protein
MILVVLALAAGLFLLTAPHRSAGLLPSSPSAINPALILTDRRSRT